MSLSDQSGPSQPGTAEGRWDSPEQICLYLARHLQDQGKQLSARVSFRPDGILVFQFLSGKEKALLFLVVGRFGTMGKRTPFGTLYAPLPGAQLLNERLIEHTASCLQAAFPDDPPVWLRKANEGIKTLGWGSEFLSEFCRDLLKPGATFWGMQRLRRVFFELPRDLVLEFEGPEPFELRLAPSDPGFQGTVVGHYGPLTLSAPDSGLLRNQLVNYVGYACSLQIPADATLDEYEMNQADWDRVVGDGLSEDAFLLNGFRCVDETYKALLGASGNIALVGMLDRECANYFRWLTGPTEESHFDLWHIWPNRNTVKAYSLVDLGDQGVLGNAWEQKSDEVLRRVLDSRPDLVVVQGGCVAELMGESVKNSLHRVLQGGPIPVPIVTLDTCLDKSDGYGQFWSDLLKATSQQTGEIEATAVNLVGYGHAGTPGYEHLLRLITLAGAASVHSLLPTFDTQRLAQFRRAALTVVYPSAHVTSAFALARESCRGTVLSLDAPWGVEPTLRWLRNLRNALGAADWPWELEQEIARQWPQSTWHSLQSEATSHRIAFVASTATLLQPGSAVRHGLPLPGFFKEMGFGLDVLVMPSRKGTSLQLPPQVLEQWGCGPEKTGEPTGIGGTRLIHSNPGDSRATILARTDAAVVYSEWEGDERILQAGKQPVSPTDFRMGIAGALYNLRFLLSLCSLQHRQTKAPATQEAPKNA